jgi:malate dehydrogenase (oxaloacetate-decarboxylating)
VVEDLAAQVQRAYIQYQHHPTELLRNIYLNNLHNKNQVVFYKLVLEHLEEMIPTIYTPIVGSAVEHFSKEFRQARGIYISYPHRDQIDTILDNRSNPEIDLIVVTDGEGVLGIGDQGVGAMDIPVAKLMVYTLCGGIDPCRTLPIMLDVGTNNQCLLDDPLYLGWHHHRLQGEQYQQFVDDFVGAVQRKFPNALLHWEDFGTINAYHNLEKYRNQMCTFNDDIQGTGVITLAAFLGALKLLDEPLEHQRIIIFGAGSAGIGIAHQIKTAMKCAGIDEDTARRCFWLIDRDGLIIEGHNKRDNQAPFARPNSEVADWALTESSHIGLAEVINHIKPTALLGCSTVGGAFTESMVKSMAHHVDYPIIFPLSNPTSKSEAQAKDLIEWTNGHAIVATGSPFNPVEHNNQIYRIAQCNNAFAFPGIGLGAIAIKATSITESMLWAAAHAIANNAPAIRNHDLTAGLLPTMQKARATAREVAIAVAKEAYEEGNCQITKFDSFNTLIDQHMWQPHYLPYYRR